MEQTKTKEYKAFLQKCLEGGLMKIDAALELAKEYHISVTYAHSLVYRFFSGEYNSNRRKDGTRKRLANKTTPKKKIEKKGSFLGQAIAEITDTIDF